jgi:hypothetical protein
MGTYSRQVYLPATFQASSIPTYYISGVECSSPIHALTFRAQKIRHVLQGIVAVTLCGTSITSIDELERRIDTYPNTTTVYSTNPILQVILTHAHKISTQGPERENALKMALFTHLKARLTC